MYHLRTLVLLLVGLCTATATATSIEQVHGFEPRFVLPPDTTMQSIRDFGAVGDGRTDDTAAFRKALGQNKPRALYIPAGTYLIREPLRFGADDSKKKKVLLIGESRSSTILRLADNSPGFDDPQKPQAFIHTLHPQQQGEQNMHNYVQHLTIEIGQGNPGAIGLQYHSNNTGAVKDVTVRSAGAVRPAVGIACMDWEVGPANLRYVTIEGFETGVLLEKVGNYVTLEHVTVRDCRIGVESRTATIRALRAINCTVPLSTRGQVVLLDSQFEGSGDAAVVVEQGSLFARKLTNLGYELTIDADVPAGDARAQAVEEYISHTPLFTGTPPPDKAILSLNLPVQESPEIQYPQSGEAWAVMPAKGDITDPLQKAIDSGVSTVYLQGGSGAKITRSIRFHGRINRIMGLGNAYLKFETADQPGFILEDGEAETVICELVYRDYGSSEGPSWLQASPRTLVYRHASGSYQTAASGRGGKVFMESVVGHPFRFDGVQAWVRDFDTEQGGPGEANTNIINRDGTLWVLGHKTEDYATKILTINGATELLGGTYRQNWDQADFDRTGIDEHNRPPLFRVVDGHMSATYVSWGPQKPFEVLVEHQQGAQVKQITRADAGGAAVLAVITTAAADGSPDTEDQGP